MSINYERVVRIRLRVYMSSEIVQVIELHHGKYFLAVTGPGLQLGFCDIDRAPRMTRATRDVWIKDLWILKNTVVKYNYVVIHRRTNDVLHNESIATREIDVGTTPLTVDATYNTVQVRFNHKRIKRRSRPRNKPRPNTRPQNQTSLKVTRPEAERERDDCQTILNQYNTIPNKDSKATDVFHTHATVNNNMMTTSKESSAKKMAKASAKDSGVERITTTNSQSERDVEHVSIVSFANEKYLQVVGNIGLAALLVFGVCKLVLK